MIFWLSIATLWQRELVRFWRQKSRLTGVIASPVLFWLVLGFGLGSTAPKFLFPGMLVLTVLFSAIFSTISIIEDRREGFLLSMLVSPAPRSSLVLGKMLGSATLAWIQGSLLLVLAPAAGVALHPKELALTSAALFLTSFLLSALGFLIAWKFDSTQGYHAVMNLLMLPMWLVSGAVFSIAGAHGWIRTIMLINPLTYALSIIRRLLAPESVAGDPGIGPSLLVTASVTALLVVASAMLARQSSTQSQA